MHRVQPLPAVVVEVAVTPPAQDLCNSNHNNNNSSSSSSTVHLGGGVQRQGQLRQGAVQAPGAVALVVGVEGEPLARAGVLDTAGVYTGTMGTLDTCRVEMCPSGIQR